MGAGTVRAVLKHEAALSCGLPAIAALMVVSRLTLLGYSILAWSGVIGLAAVALQGTNYVVWIAVVAMGGATGGLATAIVGAARHDTLL